jgi:hypothetical protein
MTKPSRAQAKSSAKKVSAVRRQSQPTPRRLRTTALITSVEPEGSALGHDVGRMIDTARTQVARAANATLTTLYWQIGHRVRTSVLDGKRAAYGAQIGAALGRRLATRVGRGFDENTPCHMLGFAEVFADPQIVSALRRQSSWRHFTVVTYAPARPRVDAREVHADFDEA